MDLAKLSFPEQRREFLFWALLLATILFAQFGQAGLFGRDLIGHDDLLYIAPLKDMSLSSYLHDWLPVRSHYAFPLTDFSFQLDFALERVTGVKTFWLLNFTLFLAGLCFFARITRLYFPAHSRIRLALIATCALHPAHVELLQWAFMRKSLLVYLFLSAGSLAVLRAARKNRAATKGEWALVWACYLASLLAFPSSVLWIYWALWMLRPQYKAKLAAFRAMCALAGLIGMLYLGWFIGGSDGWGSTFGRVEVMFAIFGLGRGVWNLLFPFWLAPYYSFGSLWNKAGLALIAALAYFAWRFRLQLREQAPLLALAAALFLPQFFNVLTYSDFVWADRYLFLPLPYLCLVGGILVSRAPPSTQKLSAGLACAMWLMYFFSIRTYAPLWKNDTALMQACALTEGSGKCLILSVEKAYAMGGCESAQPWASLAVEKLKEGNLGLSLHLRDELPFYLYLCTAQKPGMGREERVQELKQLPPELRVEGLELFVHVLLALEEGNREAAKNIARSAYFGSKAPPYTLSLGVGNLFRGQAMALCQVASDPECKAELEQTLKRMQGLSEINWVLLAGYEATLRADAIGRSASANKAPPAPANTKQRHQDK